MAFFEDFGKKITQTGQEAVQKTKDFTEITRLNGQKTEIEKQIEEHYLQIGKLYFELHSKEPETAFLELVAFVQEGQVQIRRLEEQIQQIKRTTRCLNCGAELQQGTVFCPICGTKVVENQIQRPQEIQKVCLNCGNVMREEAVFCSNCGAKATEETMSEPKVRVCPQCGCVVTEDDLFCANCGAKI